MGVFVDRAQEFLKEHANKESTAQNYADKAKELQQEIFTIIKEIMQPLLSNGTAEFRCEKFPSSVLFDGYRAELELERATINVGPKMLLIEPPEELRPNLVLNFWGFKDSPEFMIFHNEGRFRIIEEGLGKDFTKEEFEQTLTNAIFN